VANPREQGAWAPPGAFAFFYVSSRPVQFADGTICQLRSEGSRRTGKFFIRSRVMDHVTRQQVAQMESSDFMTYYLLTRLDERHCDEMVCYRPGRFLRFDPDIDRFEPPRY